MNWRGSVAAVLVMVVAASVVFFFIQRELFSASPGFSLPPEVREQIKASMDDQKLLVQMDIGQEVVHRDRFNDLETTLHRLRILEHNRDRLEDRYQLLMLGIFALSVMVATSLYAWRQSRYGPRLERLRQALTQLARGQDSVKVHDSGRDSIGKIASMIEETSKVMGRDRRQLASLENLSHWQGSSSAPGPRDEDPVDRCPFGIGSGRVAARETRTSEEGGFGGGPPPELDKNCAAWRILPNASPVLPGCRAPA